MVSDVLFEAIDHIKEYLQSGIYGPPSDPLRKRIEALVTEMDEVRQILDTLPIGSKDTQ